MTRRRLHHLGLLTGLALAAAPFAAACGSSSSSASGPPGDDVLDGSSTGNDASGGRGSADGSLGVGDDGSPGTQDGSPGSVSDGGPIVNMSDCAPQDVFLGTSIVGGGVNSSTGGTSIAADLNNDGITDFAQLDDSTPTSAFNVTLNKGNGVFGAPTSYAGPVAMGGQPLAAVDTDGDGHLDIVYAANTMAPGNGAESFGVAVALNKGDGTFKDATTTDLGGEIPLLIRGADVNGDGKSDLVMVAENTNQDTSVIVVLNTGGSFAAPVSYDVPADAGGNALSVADLNGDNKPDVVTYDDAAGPCVLMNNGDGTYKSKACYTGSQTNSTSAVAVGDVNGDKKPDILVVNFDGNFTDDVFLNKGDGTFAAPTSFSPGATAAVDGLLADLNNDGKLDVVNRIAASDSFGGYVTVSYGKGDGTFATSTALVDFGYGNANSTQLSGPLLAGDFMGNGLTGIANADLGPVHGFEITPTTCRTTIPAPFSGLPAPTTSTCASANVTVGVVHATMGPMSNNQARAVDLNKDGKTDLIAPSGDSTNLAYYALSNGDGTFGATKSIPGQFNAQIPAVGDLNGDGLVDVVFAQQDNLIVALNLGNGSFNAPTTQPLPSDANSTVALDLADLNNDGKLDVVVGDYVLFGRGDGTFAGSEVPFKLYQGESPRQFRFADLNGDNQLDVVAMQTEGGDLLGGACVSLNIGNSNFSPATCLSSASGDGPVAFAIGDVNGDKKIDIAVFNNSAADAIEIYLGNGDGTFKAGALFPYPEQVGVGFQPEALELADVDNDGKLDVLALDYAVNAIVVFPGAGDGTFSSAPVSYAIGGTSANRNVPIVLGNFLGNGLTGFGVYNNTHNGFDLFTPTCSK